MTTRNAALALAIGAWGCLVVATLVAAVGPVAIDTIDLSISGPSRLIVSAACLLALAAWLTGPRALLDVLASSPAPYVATAVLAMAIVACALLANGAVSVGGADSAGYLAQADRWLRGDVRTPAPLAIADLPDAVARQAGLGFRPDPSGTAIVPSYPPGLPWIQAAVLGVGGEPAAIRGVPLLAALGALLGIWLLARAYLHPASAALVTVVLASLPPFLFQALQPMSDVPALAAWLLALALAPRAGVAAATGSAIATFVAILIRPNLAPLAAAVCWQAHALTTTARHRGTRVMVIAASAGAALAVVASVQWALYGSPLQSGYGRAGELFSTAHVGPNLRLYAAWLHEAVSLPSAAVLIAGLAGLAIGAIHRPGVRPLLLAVGFTIACYLVYVPFDSWTYLRFVLVALAIAPIGAAIAIERGAVAWPAIWRFPLVAACTLVLVAANLQHAKALGVFDLRAREYRYEAAGRFLRADVPGDAVIVAAQHSTSAPYYSGRALLRADLLDEPGFARVAAWATAQGRPLVFVLDTAEADAFQERLGTMALAALDWPPRAEIGRPVATRIWVSTDRAAHVAGSPVRTTRVTVVP